MLLSQHNISVILTPYTCPSLISHKDSSSEALELLLRFVPQISFSCAACWAVGYQPQWKLGVGYLLNAQHIAVYAQRDIL